MTRGKKVYVYKVEGTTRFPIDMLRYDRATPATEGDSAVIRAALVNALTERVVMLRSERQPTQGRWNSFGWAVSDVQVSS